ncbi:scopoletin glucosyltransferase-like [Senna tora]|uniref:Scopoletin glucosyltransferase-like n=1 Tax=Senna tora TaxID=362788 RepID=A0A834T6Z2_9FABA|nr:scopoletin glucosyltransferase-like [Senna tora]
MASKNHKLHIFFFPVPAQGHMIPMVDMAKLFAARGVRATIVTTPLNLPFVSRTIGIPKTPQNPNIFIDIVPIKFPSVEAGLPEGCETIDAIPSPSLMPNFFRAIQMLQKPFEQLLLQYNPHCLIADMFFPWTSYSAAKFKIPRIVFHGTGSFALCATECVRLYKPHKKVSSDSEPFVIPNLPGEIKMTKMVLPEHIKRDDENDWAKMEREYKELELKSFGVIVNSFYELEEVYADHYNKVLGRKIWHVGPVSLCNRDMKEKANRGKEASIDEQECLKWLHSKTPNSVLYVCFGSMVKFPKSQLSEIAMGLEASGQNFIWVVRKNQKDKEEEDKEEWLPEGFEKRMEGKGLIIRGWAPQVLILDHKAIGGFVTHCGWNSTLEGVSAGVPMVTWPVSAEQFYNEKFVTEVLGIGVAVGVKKWAGVAEGDGVKKEAIEKAVRKIMDEEEGKEMRMKAKNFAKKAKEAVKEGDGVGAVGGVFRDHEGLCVGAFSGKVLPMGDVTLMEALGMRKGIEVARDGGITHIIVESDSKIVVDMLHSPCTHESRLSAVCKSIIELCKQFSDCDIRWVPRVCNSSAHCMARLALNFNDDKVWPDSAPIWLTETCTADLN